MCSGERTGLFESPVAGAACHTQIWLMVLCVFEDGRSPRSPPILLQDYTLTSLLLLGCKDRAFSR